MNENPYAPAPLHSDAVGVRSGLRDDLRSVAKFQKGIIVCIAIYLLAFVIQFAFPRELRPIVAIGVVLTGVVGAAFVFLLAIKVYGKGVGVLLGLLSLVPFLGLVVLLIINGKATSILKQNGIEVGFFGANVAAI
jgi:hypothetical protein